MAVYNTSELFNKLCEILNDGYDYIEISECGDDKGTFLSFDCIANDYEMVSYETVNECHIPENYDVENLATKTVNGNDFCNEIVFTYDEIYSLKHAIDNVLEYFKDCANDPINKSNLSDIKKASVNCRNLQAKFVKFFKKIKSS